MIRVGVVGGTGYTGVELLRLLLCHPGVTVSVITSRSEAGRRLDDLFPSLLGTCELAFTDPAQADYSSCDVVFFATPHNVAMREVPALLDQGIRVVDLSADFRLKDVGVWEQLVWRDPSFTGALCRGGIWFTRNASRGDSRCASGGLSRLLSDRGAAGVPAAS